MKKINVPLLKQRKMACGPTSLAMVLKYFNTEASPTKILREIGGVKSFGVRMTNLAKYARSLGYTAHCYSYNERLAKKDADIVKPSKKLILKYLRRRLPVIVAVRTFLLNDKEPSEMGHIIVITKYEKGVFWFNDSSTAKVRKIKEDDFLFAWYNNTLEGSAHTLVIEPSR